MRKKEKNNETVPTNKTTKKIIRLSNNKNYKNINMTAAT